MEKGYDIQDGKCVFFLNGRITSENASALQQELRELQETHPDSELILDAQKLDSISSAGLRVFLEMIRKDEKQLTIRNVSPSVYSILEMTGFTEMMHVEKALRMISTENCPLIGAGRSSTVYRLDQDTIVKKFDVHVPVEMIHREMELARNALIAGIPTAIPFDLVRADDSYGLVFELIAPAATVGNTITEHMERFEELTKECAALLNQIHHTTVGDKDHFPSVKDLWTGWVEGMTPYYSAEETALLREMVRGVPERNTVVHSDFHENNILVYRDGLILIDMMDIGHGHPIFDLAGIAFRAHASLIPGRKPHHGLSAENMQRFWKSLLRYYFETEDSERLKKLEEMCYAFGLVRSALFPMKHVEISDDLRQIHITDARQNLFPREDWALRQLENLGRFFPDDES